MKIKVKNLGALKQAEFTLGDLTIICGENNTGKTYATYALFGFLSIWQEMLSIEINPNKIEQLLSDGVMRLDLQEYVAQIEEIFTQGCQQYTHQLSKIFASHPDRFKDAEFNIILDTQNIISSIEEYSFLNFKLDLNKLPIFSINKNLEFDKSTELIITLLVDKNKIKIPTNIIVLNIESTIKDIIFSQFFPRPFIASAERTGAAIFYKSLNLARSNLLDNIVQIVEDDEDDINRLVFSNLLKNYPDYPLPIKTNLEFMGQLQYIVRKESFIAKNHPDILNDFANIIGGKYIVTENDELYYRPKGKNINLLMSESSSSVRSLLDIGFYLRHEAEVGDLLIIDEPELNLHPENQRRIARLFARIVNIGIKVFITTHSDYIIKELNTLIMLKQDKPHLKRIAKNEGYKENELLSCEKIKVYIAEEALIKLEGKTKRTRCPTLTVADINQEQGIEVRSFDDTIDKMNQIQGEIVSGGD